jgi:SAM-dependent methyltransferase
VDPPVSLEDLYGHLWAALGENELAAADDDVSPPRGPELLFEITDAIAPRESSLIVDLGCGPGDHASALSERYGSRVVGIDPLLPHLVETARRSRALPVGGVMESIPLPAGSVDLLWLRDALLHSARPERTLEECHRVLRGGGHLLLHAAFATDELSARELGTLVTDLRVQPGSLDLGRVSTAIDRCGFVTVREEVLGSELAEHYESADGLGSRALMRLARLKREPERLARLLGDERYRAAYGVYNWVVFELLGKVSYRTLLLHKEA